MASSLTVTEGYVSRQEGGRMYYTKLGQGEPLVFVPAGSGRTLRRVADEFAKHFTCYIQDSVGSDRSDIPRSWIATRKWTVPDYTAAALEFMDLMDVKQAHLIGDHTGSMVVLDIAANHPERVKKIVMDSLPYWNLRRGEIIWERFFKLQHTDRTSFDVPVDPLLPPWEEARKQDPDLTREEWELQDELRRRDRRWQVAHEFSNTHFDTEVLGPKVKAPTLLLYGEREILRRGEQRALDGIKGSILKVVADSPKEGVATGGVHNHKPEEFTRLALEFLLS